MKLEWIIAISSLITSLGVGLIAWQTLVSIKQLKVLKKQITSDHERSRRQRAIDVLEKWANTLDRARPSARTIIEGLSIEECRLLKDKKPISIPDSKLYFLENALQDLQNKNFIPGADKKILLDEKQVAHLYYLAISHLNSLEIALQSWLSGVADKNILESELKYLVKPDNGQYVMANFREIMGGGSAYPAISAFVEHLESTLKPSTPKVLDNIV